MQFINDLQGAWQKHLPAAKKKAKLPTVTMTQHLGGPAETGAKLVDVATYLPENSNLLNDQFNGRWRLSWRAPWSAFPSVSRSWASRGTDGEVDSLAIVLTTVWGHVAKATGTKCLFSSSCSRDLHRHARML